MAQFIPAILAPSETELTYWLNQLETLASRIHLDFADNSLVANRTVLPAELKSLPSSTLFDAHLMVNQPSRYLPDLARLTVDRVIVHLEATEETSQALATATDYRLSVGLAINPNTSLSALLPYRSQIDLVQLMAIEPGFGGQPFKDETLDRIREVKRLLPELPLAVDGGVRLTNAKAILAAGADILIAGPGGYEVEGSITKGIKMWRNVINSQDTK